MVHDRPVICDHFYVGLPAMAVKQSIAFVANTSWSIYKFRLYLIEKLLKQGFAIFILAPRDTYTAKFDSVEGLTFIELYELKGKSISPYSDLLLYRELKQHYKTIRPGLIFHYTIKANLFGALAAAHAGIPSVSVITGLGYTFAEKGWLQSAVKLLYRRILKHNKEVWFLNGTDREFFITRKLIPAEKTFILPGEGVDPETFYPTPFKSKDQVTFLLIGRLIRHKGVDEFIHAAALLKEQGLDIKCQLLGFFDEQSPVAIPKERIEEWTAKKLITYEGSTDNVIPYIEQADCIVLPSYREGMPLSLLEGASMCKALIATDTAGCRDVIIDGINGYLCRIKDSNDLAAKMAAYYQLPANAKREMGSQGRALILQKFTRDIVVKIYLDKINKLGGPDK